MASSLDQIGLITKTVEDARIVFEAIAGKDPLDSTSVELTVSDFGFRISDLRVGVPKEYFINGMDKGVEETVRNAIKKLETAGAKIEEISLPHCTDYALAAYYIIMPSEVSANLARYDGTRFGRDREKGFGEEVRRRIMLGTYALSSGYYGAYYLKAQKVRTKIIEDFSKAFKDVDVIAAPTVPTTAFKLGDKNKDPLNMYLADIFVTAVNLAGLPGISIPCGQAGKLPVGLQIIGRPFEENKILYVGEFFESQSQY